MKKKVVIIIVIIAAIFASVWWAFSATRPNTSAPERDTAFDYI
jgi:hypothetical protein